jgi:micrococcal nuclease
MTSKDLNEQNLWNYKVKVVRVYDGDTIFVNIDQGFNDWKMNQPIRLCGVNAPEVRGVGKEEGLKVKAIVEEMIANKPVVLHTIDKKDKYGRWLGFIYIDGLNLNQLLLENGHAVPYMD